jgi:NAD(P)-dependent dehydrogenase (short-subunit alcohol dehydrogenase family)
MDSQSSPSQYLKGRTAVITGATAGIGLATAVAFARAGALVLGTGRDPRRCSAAEQQVLKAAPGAEVCYMAADLSLQSGVRQLAHQIPIELQGLPLDILVNNAGVYLSRFTQTADGIETTMAVNHLAPFLLTNELLAFLFASPQGRVITVSSNSHVHTRLDLVNWNTPRGYHGLKAYKQTKLCNILFTCELARRMRGTRVRAFAVDPGLVNTAIGMKSTDGLARLVWQLRRRQGTPPHVPARTILYLAAEPGLQKTTEVYWRDCRPKAPSREALDLLTAGRLWELSARLCGLAPAPRK